MPRTYWPDDEEDVRAAAREIDFPAILKPARGHRLRDAMGGDKVVVAETPKDLIGAYRRLAPLDHRLLIQEVIPGDEANIQVGGCYLDDEGRPLAVFIGRKLRQYPNDFGSASLAVSDWDERVARRSVEFLRRVEFSGICGTEFKLDPRDGRPKMIEVNPRITLWMSLTSASGIDIPLVAYRDAIGQEVQRSRQEDGVRWSYLARDLQTSAKYLVNGRIGLGAYLTSLRGLREEAVWAGDDWLPALGYPVYAASRL